MDSVLRFLEMSHWAELPATAFALIFLLLLLKEKALAWPFGIASSVLFVYIFLDAKLFMEAYLYGFYVLAGIYGWWHWSFGKKLENQKLQIIEWKQHKHVWAVILSAALSILLGYELAELRPDASLPYFDSFTTIFALLATYMQSRKILSSWIYWMIINPASAVMYWLKDLHIAPWLMLFYAIMSLGGFLKWRKSFTEQNKWQIG